jgi:hypothetical protein
VPEFRGTRPADAVVEHDPGTPANILTVADALNPAVG